MGKKLKIYLISFKRGVISKNVKQTSKKNLFNECFSYGVTGKPFPKKLVTFWEFLP